MKFSFLFFSILFFVQLSNAQGIRINTNDKILGTSFLEEHPSPKFTDYFEPDSVIELYDKRPYVQKKVKSIEIRNAEGALAFSAEFNQKGQIKSIGRKCKGRYFMVSDSVTFRSKKIRVINRYFDKRKLIRLDTITIVPRIIKRVDTLIQYNFISNKSYKNGRLLIERNHYYNERYYNKMLLMKKPKGQLMIGDWDEKEESKIYLEKKLSIVFQPDSMYAVSMKTMAADVQLSIDTAKHFLSSGEAKIIAINFREDTAIYFAEGENFNEPVEWISPFYCGNAFQSKYSADYYYKYGKNGLVEHYYRNSWLNLNGLEINNNGQILYKFYYTFFKFQTK